MRPGRWSGLRLALRSLAHRRGQTVLILLLGALISGTTVFAAGYQRQIQQAAVDAAFAADGPQSAWQLVGPEETSPRAVIPDDADRWFEPPIAGRTVGLLWVTPRFASGINGTLLWRQDSCDHLVLSGGRCPDGIDEVAVSAADAERYGVASAEHLVEELSGGQQQRVAIARALAGRPRVLLADQVTTDLDPANRVRVLGLLRDLADDGSAVLVASDDPGVTEACDRTVTL